MYARPLAGRRVFVTDSIGVGLAGSRHPRMAEVAAAAAGWGQGSDARDWARGRRWPAPTAAMLNAYQIHNQEFDCVHERAVVHPLATILPALLAQAERQSQAGASVSGAALIEALVLGVDVATTLGSAQTAPMRFFRPAMCGALGASLGLAKLAKLAGCNRAQMADALGIAYSQLAGTRQAHTEGSPMLALQGGLASRAAVISLDLARAGFSGPREVLQGALATFDRFDAAAPDLSAADALRVDAVRAGGHGMGADERVLLAKLLVDHDGMRNDLPAVEHVLALMNSAVRADGVSPLWQARWWALVMSNAEYGGRVTLAREALSMLQALLAAQPLPELALAVRALDASGEADGAARSLCADALRRCAAAGYTRFLVAHPGWAARLAAVGLEDGVCTAFLTDAVRERSLPPPQPWLTAWPWRLRVQVLGGLLAWRDDVPLAGSTKAQRRPRELLALLAAHPGGLSAVGLMDALWPSLDAEAPKASLEMAIARLRKWLDWPESVRVADGRIALNPSAVWTDVAALEAAAAAGDAAAALALYRGAYLAGEPVQGLALRVRERLASRLAAVVLKAAAAHRAAGRGDQALALLAQAMAGEPTEPAAAAWRAALSAQAP